MVRADELLMIAQVLDEGLNIPEPLLTWTEQCPLEAQASLVTDRALCSALCACMLVLRRSGACGRGCARARVVAFATVYYIID